MPFMDTNPKLSLLLPAPPPVCYTTGDNPDRAEDGEPDNDIRQHLAKGDQPVPGTAGDFTRTPAGKDINVPDSNLGAGIAPVVGHLQGDGIVSGGFVGVGGVGVVAGLAVTKVPLIAVG